METEVTASVTDRQDVVPHNMVADKEVLDYRGSKKLGTAWYGGNFFNREHPIFDGLPVNCVFN